MRKNRSILCARFSCRLRFLLHNFIFNHVWFSDVEVYFSSFNLQPKPRLSYWYLRNYSRMSSWIFPSLGSEQVEPETLLLSMNPNISRCSEFEVWQSLPIFQMKKSNFKRLKFLRPRKWHVHFALCRFLRSIQSWYNFQISLSSDRPRDEKLIRDNFKLISRPDKWVL